MTQRRCEESNGNRDAEGRHDAMYVLTAYTSTRLARDVDSGSIVAAHCVPIERHYQPCTLTSRAAYIAEACLV